MCPGHAEHSSSSDEDARYKGRGPDKGPRKLNAARKGEKAPAAKKAAAPKPTATSRKAKPQRQKEQWSDPEGELDIYRELVTEKDVEFLQLDPRTWIAEVYNVSENIRRESFPDSGSAFEKWTFVTATMQADMTLLFSCSHCPQNKRWGTCVHTLFLRRHAFQYVLFSEQSDPRSTVFVHEYRDVERALPDATSVDGWSKTTTRYHSSLISVSERVGNRGRGQILVSHVGPAVDDGIYRCQRCTKSHVCVHIEEAKELLRTHRFMPDTSSTADAGEAIPYQEPLAFVDVEDEIQKMDERSISHKAVPPPVWTRLPGDPSPAEMLKDFPRQLNLGDDEARCCCGTSVGADVETVMQDCIIYDTTACFPAQIEVRRCTTCSASSRRKAGPDLCSLGLFNLDNHTIVSHRLLNKYDAYFSSQEGTFVAFSRLLECEYQMHGSEKSVLPADKFRRCYFAFCELQQLDDSFRCDVCGSNPEVVIADGVTVSYQKSKRTSHLRPPTRVTPTSPIHQDVKPPKQQPQLVPDRELRAEAAELVKIRLGKNTRKRKQPRKTRDWDIAETSESEAEDDEDQVNSSELSNRARDIARKLERVNHALATIFERYIGSEDKSAVESDMRWPWRRLLEQLLANESVLQFASYASWPLLTLFAESGDKAALIERLRVVIPAFGAVASVCWENRHENPQELSDVVALSTFIRETARKVYARLRVHNTEPAADLAQEDWKKTGCFYPMPKVRERPIYNGLPHDGSYERNVLTGREGIGCSKYYAAYGKKGFTGGLLGFWCTHGICLGFHCIPEGEGRNDVFSGVYTRWKVAPRVIVYDFACALAPYCMLREPDYFKNTLFVIDHFHAKGHKGCSPACFLSTYGDNDPRLKAINSSAAEMGNSMLKHIRKSIRYMTEGHSILYVHRFLSLWNRTRRLKMMAAQARAQAKESL